jgi:hypothetical protein
MPYFPLRRMTRNERIFWTSVLIMLRLAQFAIVAAAVWLICQDPPR